jgi:hypothetical protein
MALAEVIRTDVRVILPLLKEIVALLESGEVTETCYRTEMN